MNNSENTPSERTECRVADELAEEVVSAPMVDIIVDTHTITEHIYMPDI